MNTDVKATVTITFSTGNPYSEEVNATTNIHGLLSFEFGGDALNGRNWEGATIAVKVVNAATPSTVYVNDGARPVSAVPYALSVNGQSIQNYLTEHNYVDLGKLKDTLNAYPTTAVMDARHYLTSDSAVITTMQGNITVNANNITTNTTNIATNAADIVALANRVNTFNTNVCDSVKNCDFSDNTSIKNMLQQLTARLDSLEHVISSQDSTINALNEQVNPFTCGTSKVKDVDNNEYPTVKIGNQCWMKENLRTTKYANGTAIAKGTGTSTTTAYRYYPNNDSSKVSTYGYLYNWKAVMDTSSSSEANPSGVQGICPVGWHVPSNAEWDTLTNYVNIVANGYRCGGVETIAKALASKTGWDDSGNSCAVGNAQDDNNATGFSAVPAGSSGPDYTFGSDACFWSATEVGSGVGAVTAIYRSLSSGASNVDSDGEYKDNGYSVRCLRD